MSDLNKKYLSITRASIMDNLTYRSSHFITVFGNAIYLIIIFYLWKAIYESSTTDVVNGMTYQDTISYLVLATALFNLMEGFLVWEMGYSIKSGMIIMNMIKPIDFQLYTFFKALGGYLLNFFVTFLPTFLIVYIFTKGAIPIGVNLLLCMLSIIPALVINFHIDMFVGTIGFYTQSTWGVNIMKEVVVLLLSGAAVPLAFFPERLRTIVNCLPFQSIYNTPLQILTDSALTPEVVAKMMAQQILWAIVMIFLSRLFWKHAQKIITVNGG